MTRGNQISALNIEESDKGEKSEVPTYEEIEESIKKLKNGRAPGEENNFNILLYNSFCEWNDKICLKLKRPCIFSCSYTNTKSWW